MMCTDWCSLSQTVRDRDVACDLAVAKLRREALHVFGDILHLRHARPHVAQGLHMRVVQLVGSWMLHHLVYASFAACGNGGPKV